MKIAVDGPAGAGKSTLARALARKLGFIYIDTGAMYRALTWKALQLGIDLQDSDSLRRLAESTDIDFANCDGEQRLICSGDDITDLVRSPEVDASVSTVAAFPAVREIMVSKQQAMARSNNVVMDGRDIGEMVLPDADFKFYVTASLEERARRRALDMQEKGFTSEIAATKLEIEKRDQLDTDREVGALKILPDSIVIDTSHQSAEGTLTCILSIIGEV